MAKQTIRPAEGDHDADPRTEAAAGLTVHGLVGVVAGQLVLAGQQIVMGFAQLSGSVVTGTWRHGFPGSAAAFDGEAR